MSTVRAGVSGPVRAHRGAGTTGEQVQYLGSDGAG